MPCIGSVDMQSPSCLLSARTHVAFSESRKYLHVVYFATCLGDVRCASRTSISIGAWNSSAVVPRADKRRPSVEVDIGRKIIERQRTEGTYLVCASWRIRLWAFLWYLLPRDPECPWFAVRVSLADPLSNARNDATASFLVPRRIVSPRFVD